MGDLSRADEAFTMHRHVMVYITVMYDDTVSINIITNMLLLYS